MWRQFVLTSLCVVALAGIAQANGRAPGTSTINFRQGAEQHIAAGMTFGLLYSDDGGATWQWSCEDAVGYGGMYDPDYAYTSTGALFATTFDGVKVNRDGCTFAPTSLEPAPPAVKFFSVIAQGPDGAIYAAAADPMDAKIYKSTDNGMTFPVAAAAGQLNDWYQSLEVAPSNASVIYVSGYRIKAGQPKVFLLFKSTNGGASYAPLPVTDFATMPNSTIDIVGIDPANPNLVYARVTLEDNSISDAIYRSTDGGQSWTRILGKQASIAFLVRKTGELVAATQAFGTVHSTNTGTTWTDVAGAPHINCLAENSAGEVWACTQNYGSPQVPSDDFGIMKSTNLTTWTGVVKYQDIQEPRPCAAGTPQKDQCDAVLWCGLCSQLGCTANRDCAAAGDGGPGVDQTVVQKPPKGCCETGGEGVPGLLAIGIAVGMVMLRRPRRTRC
ncbi:MAG TPA: hypothetical protein VFQ53_20705 [Kofleriaceae bacterium]|nr:hypothetical protein [Kofleriaceae bacterium]